MVGSINEKHGNQIVAFRTGEPVTLEYLNAYARPENRVDVNKPFKPSKITRAAAREAYPGMSELLSRAKSTRKNGTLQERYMATIRMHFTIGGCGRYYQSGADTGISF